MRAFRFVPPQTIAAAAGGQPAEVWSTRFVLQEFVLKQAHWLSSGKARLALSIHAALEDGEDTEERVCTLQDEEHENLLAAMRSISLQSMTSRFARFFLLVLDAVESATTPERKA